MILSLAPARPHYAAIGTYSVTFRSVAISAGLSDLALRRSATTATLGWPVLNFAPPAIGRRRGTDPTRPEAVPAILTQPVAGQSVHPSSPPTPTPRPEQQHSVTHGDTPTHQLVTRPAERRAVRVRVGVIVASSVCWRHCRVVRVSVSVACRCQCRRRCWCQCRVVRVSVSVSPCQCQCVRVSVICVSVSVCQCCLCISVGCRQCQCQCQLRVSVLVSVRPHVGVLVSASV